MSAEVHILGAGLSGLSSATILAKAGKDVHVHEIRSDSGARFDGDFQGIENWTSEIDFFEELADWGFDATEFKSDSFGMKQWNRIKKKAFVAQNFYHSVLWHRLR